MRNIKCAVFDMDGTLVDSLMIWDVIWDAFGERFLGGGFRPTDEDDRAVRTMTLKAAMERIHKAYGIGRDGDELLEYANEITKEFYANRVEMKEGAIEILEHFQKCGVKMCIASATDPTLIDIAVKHCNIGKYFSAVFSCSEIGKGKDAPDVFLKALEYFGTKREETWVFEDSAVAITTAHRAGFPTVGIYDRYNYGHDIIRATATVYIGEGESLKKLIKE